MTPATDLERDYADLLKKLPSKAPIYLPTDKIPLADKIRGIEHVIRIYKQDLDAIYRPKLRALREKFKGSRRCFLIGNGPSLNETDLAMLKNEVTFAVNGFFLKTEALDWKPTFYVVEDHLVAEDRAKWINEFKGPTKLFPAYLGYVFEQSDDTIFYNHRPRKSYPHGFDFSLDAAQITYTGCTVTFSMMQLAAYLGFEEIYLIGVDASYEIPKDAQENKDSGVGVIDMKSDDPNHFDKDYFGKGFRWHDPQVDKMLEAYAEAHRVLAGTTQRIYNAGIGGKLEIFERRPFSSLFPLARSAAQVLAENEARRLAAEAAAYPKLLILDMTAMGNGTATGEIKSTLFGNWPQGRILQIARQGKDSLSIVKPAPEGGYAATLAKSAEAEAEIAAFAADVILYRPVPDLDWLHRFAMDVIKAAGKPLVTWIMDDWPSRLEEMDAAQAKSLLPDLAALFRQSRERLSISDAMSQAFAPRYGGEFTAIANGIDPADWPAPRQHAAGPMLVRYSGGLAADMTLASVLRVARSVEELAKSGVDIRFEINTQKWGLDKSEALFAGLDHTTIGSETLSTDAYRAWLSAADVVVIAYNFDPETLRYVRYSMANKTPECLVCGAALLAIGPRDIATIGYLGDSGAAVVVGADSDVAVTEALLSLQQHPERRTELAAAGHALATTRHNLTTLRNQLRELIQRAAKPAEVQQARAVAPPAQVLELAQLTENFKALSAYAAELEKRHSGPRPVLRPLSQPLPEGGDLLTRLAAAKDPASARLLLISLASALLLNSGPVRRQIESDKKVKDALAKALNTLPKDDPVRGHFLKVQDHHLAATRRHAAE